MRILVAEDEPVSRDLLSGILKSMGYAPDFVENGRQAVAAAVSRQYDVVLMDIQMPGMNGLEATRAIIRSQNVQAKPVIIAVTGLTKDGMREKCIEAGMNDYLAKPVTSESIRLMLLKWNGASSGTVAAPPRKEEHVDKDLIDRLELLARETDPVFLKELIEMFLRTTPDQVRKIRLARDQCDAKLLHEAAHALKGSTANIGALRLSNLCLQLEDLGEFGNVDSVRSLIGELEKEFYKVCEELHRYAERLNTA